MKERYTFNLHSNKFFEQIDEALDDSGIVQEYTHQSTKWYERNVLNLTGPGHLSLITAQKQTQGTSIVSSRQKLYTGRMYLFRYVPVNRATLPYYDQFPLVMVLSVDKKKGTFLGLNMHYLPVRSRALLMYDMIQRLHLKFQSNPARTKLKNFDYANLHQHTRLIRKLSTPCIHQYRFDHIRSHLLKINFDHWEKCLFLPFDKFAKKSKASVWVESKRIARKS